MELNLLDISIFVAFFVVVVGVSMYKSRKEETGEDYFLAGRGLTWPLIGFSLIAANISTEHFVGMSGQGAGMGLAVASYEWVAAITLVFVSLLFLPKFLQSGIYTIPEFLEYRYNAAARAIMAVFVMIMYVIVAISAVVYSGGLTLHVIFDMNLTTGIWLIGCIAALYTIWGGLKAVAWADLFQGSALLIGGAITMVLGFVAVGKLSPASSAASGGYTLLMNGIRYFNQTNADKLHMFLPADHPIIPWTALVVGIWIPNFYYWGLNQFITQRTLAAKTLRQGQLGIIFAASLKLIIPFLMVFPGIMALQLYHEEVAAKNDAAYPVLIKNLITPGLRGFIFAAIAGAVISSLASMLNSASTIFTMDLYKRHVKPNASEKSLVWIGRVTTLLFMLLACTLIAPSLDNPRFQGIFNYIQSVQGYITPGILCAFVFGLIVKRAPSAAAITAMALNVPIYGFCHIPKLVIDWCYHRNHPGATEVVPPGGFWGHVYELSSMAYLNHMAITFGILILAMLVVTLIWPLRQPKTMPVRAEFDMRPTPAVLWLGAAVIAVTICLYIKFR
ncbi:MAG: solute:sodium symporter family transporter [Phycisphaerae bacterium]|nr:solute:sodium symporter family transporter [Phycisphaerae bacterium]